MAEGADDLGARRATRIVDPPREHANPHPDDRLREHVGIEARPCLATRHRSASPRPDAAREALEHARPCLGPFASGREYDPEQLAMIVGEAHKGLGLGLDDRLLIRPERGGGDEPRLELVRGLVGQLPEELALVLEVEIERSGSESGGRGDLVARHTRQTMAGEESAPGIEQTSAGALGARAADHGRLEVRTDGHVIYDSNVILAVR